MSRRIAHRARYRNMQQLVPPFKDSQQAFLRPRWSYRSQQPHLKIRPLGYSLSLLPLPRHPFFRLFK
jgi:hypothetical protein